MILFWWNENSLDQEYPPLRVTDGRTVEFWTRDHPANLLGSLRVQSRTVPTKSTLHWWSLMSSERDAFGWFPSHTTRCYRIGLLVLTGKQTLSFQTQPHYPGYQTLRRGLGTLSRRMGDLRSLVRDRSSLFPAPQIRTTSLLHQRAHLTTFVSSSTSQTSFSIEAASPFFSIRAHVPGPVTSLDSDRMDGKRNHPSLSAGLSGSLSINPVHIIPSQESGVLPLQPSTVPGTSLGDGGAQSQFPPILSGTDGRSSGVPGSLPSPSLVLFGTDNKDPKDTGVSSSLLSVPPVMDNTSSRVPVTLFRGPPPGYRAPLVDTRVPGAPLVPPASSSEGQRAPISCRDSPLASSSPPTVFGSRQSARRGRYRIPPSNINVPEPSPDLCQAIADNVPLPDQVPSRTTGSTPRLSVPASVSNGDKTAQRSDTAREGEQTISYQQLWKEREEAREWARVSASELARAQRINAELDRQRAELEVESVGFMNLLGTAREALRNEEWAHTATHRELVAAQRCTQEIRKNEEAACRISTDLREQVDSLLNSLANVTSERTQSCHEAAELHQRIAGLETTIETQNLQVSHLHTAWIALREDAAQTPDLVLALQQRLSKILVLPPTMTIPQILVEANQFLDWLLDPQSSHPGSGRRTARRRSSNSSSPETVST